jgi:hypothetical protein
MNEPKDAIIASTEVTTSGTTWVPCNCSASSCLTCAEYSTVAHWRTQQVESAKSTGVVFTEPGATCVNARADKAEADIYTRDLLLSELSGQVLLMTGALRTYRELHKFDAGCED